MTFGVSQLVHWSTDMPNTADMMWIKSHSNRLSHRDVIQFDTWSVNGVFDIAVVVMWYHVVPIELHET